MTDGTAAAGRGPGSILAAVEGTDDARGNDTALVPFIGVLRMSALAPLEVQRNDLAKGKGGGGTRLTNSPLRPRTSFR